MIEVEQLSKVYQPGVGPEVRALDQVSFSAAPGEVFGLLGPNGAGKTTLLRIVATMLRPSAGTVRVDGVDVRHDPTGVRRRIGFLSASTGLYERLTPRETLRLFGRLHGLDAAGSERRIEELLALLDMGGFADRPCGTLSAGQRQKTSIARALVHDPPVLVFDEPTANLDVLVGKAVLERIATLRAGRRTIVLSTHVLSEAERLCDRVAIVHHGRLLALGTKQEVAAQAFGAGALGAGALGAGALGAGPPGSAGLEEAFFALVREDEARV